MMQNWERVLNYLQTKGEPVNINIICNAIPDLTVETIKETLKELVVGGDVLQGSEKNNIGNYVRTWEALQ